jgi:hypothetical protein
MSKKDMMRPPLREKVRVLCGVETKYPSTSNELRVRLSVLKGGFSGLAFPAVQTSDTSNLSPPTVGNGSEGSEYWSHVCRKRCRIIVTGFDDPPTRATL